MRLAQNGLNRHIPREECSEILEQIWTSGLRLDDQEASSMIIFISAQFY